MVTSILLFLIRFGTEVSLPGLDGKILESVVNSNSPIRNFIASSSVSNKSIGLLALGISPYISASIVLQLIIATNPELKKIQREEGRAGRKKIFRYTRYLTLFWALLQSLGITFSLRTFLFDSRIINVLEISIILTTGAMILAWISELLTKYGIANGSSLLVFVNILNNAPKDLSFLPPDLRILDLVLFPLALSISLGVAILLQETFYNVQIVSAKELVVKPENNTQNDQQYIPFRINQGGVMPLVFVSYLLQIIDALIDYGISSNLAIFSLLPNFIGKLIYLALEFFLICFFNYYYVTLIFDPTDISEDLRKRAFFIPGIKPGKQTLRYIDQLSKRLALYGGIILASVNLMLNFVNLFIRIPILPGTISSQVIVVGVLVEVIQKIRIAMLSEVYKEILNKKE
uniref:preprotein translocase subunit SecY n=1 Tax=Haramonas pauciplastida TaxID=478668 RepID=UPI0021146195|nr:preprotein translocase subunit SecY [Haramonas pauciplastida]UTE94964.1 preprotein translocase subunit SecY [Haramonas pauciplastida]